MLHVVKLIERRFPERCGRIVGALVVLSASALPFGAGLLFLG